MCDTYRSAEGGSSIEVLAAEGMRRGEEKGNKVDIIGGEAVMVMEPVGEMVRRSL